MCVRTSYKSESTQFIVSSVCDLLQSGREEMQYQKLQKIYQKVLDTCLKKQETVCISRRAGAQLATAANRSCDSQPRQRVTTRVSSTRSDAREPSALHWRGGQVELRRELGSARDGRVGGRARASCRPPSLRTPPLGLVHFSHIQPRRKGRKSVS